MSVSSGRSRFAPLALLSGLVARRDRFLEALADRTARAGTLRVGSTPGSARAGGLVDLLESRRLMAATPDPSNPALIRLSTTSGLGSVDAVVDVYGGFGLTLTGTDTRFNNPSLLTSGIVDGSAVTFGPGRLALTALNVTPTSLNPLATNLPVPSFPEGSPNTVVTNFTLTGTYAGTTTPYAFDVTLTQTLSFAPVRTSGTSHLDIDALDTTPLTFQSILTQSYSFLNLLGTDATIDLTRYYRPTSATGFTPSVDASGQLPQRVAGALDAGRTLVNANVSGVFGSFVFDPVDTANNSAYTAIRSFGGSFQQYSIFAGDSLPALIQNGGIPTAIAGPSLTATNAFYGTASALNPNSYAQQNTLTIGPRQSAVYSTQTIFSQNVLTSVYNHLINPTNLDASSITPSQPTDTAPPAPGDFAFASPVLNVDLPAGSTAPVSVQVPVLRLGGQFGTSTPSIVAISLVDGSIIPTPPGAITVSTSTVSFQGDTVTLDATDPAADTFFLVNNGAVSATATVIIDPALAGTLPSSFGLVVQSGGTTSGIANPATLRVNVYPQTPVFTLGTNGSTGTAIFSASAGQPSVTLTINRLGLPNGPAAVNFATTGGTAVAGRDYTAVNTTVNFADGETQQTVVIPLLNGPGDALTRTITYAISPAVSTAPGAVTAPSIVQDAVSGTGNYAALDVIGPTITDVRTTTAARRNGITSVVLTFSEALRGVSNLGDFTIALRSAEGPAGSARLGRPIVLSRALYNAADRTVTLIPRSPLRFNTNYLVGVSASPTLTDLAGNVVNRVPNAPPPAGLTFLNYFARGTAVTYVDDSGDRVRLIARRGGQFELLRSSNGEATRVALATVNNTPVFSANLLGPARSRGTALIQQILAPSNYSVLLGPGVSTGV